jgi:hypothetical protein
MINQPKKTSYNTKEDQEKQKLLQLAKTKEKEMIQG